MREDNKISPTDLMGIYGELAELVGVDGAIKVYEHFKGQQVSFPMRLYTKEYVISQVNSGNEHSVKKTATLYGYSERRLRQILNESQERKNKS